MTIQTSLDLQQDAEEARLVESIAQVDRFESILFGADPAERIVAAEPAENKLCVWRRLADGTVARTWEPFAPWILTTAPQPILASEPCELEGEGYRFLYEFHTWSAFQDARRLLR